MNVPWQIRLLRVAALLGLLQPGVTAAADDLTDWRYSRDVQFNTSASGANVAGDVSDFPVAVALSAENFDFSQALQNGADVRFTAGKDGTPLSHSIEHWGRDDRSALVWVKVDAVRGNSTSQSIVMHWGNPAAKNASDSAAVFDTKQGFVGAWHLAEEGGTSEVGYKDATANAANATGVNMTPESRAAGVLGPAAKFRHADNQWIKIDGEKRKLFDLTDRLTFSAWAWADSFANRGDEARRAPARLRDHFRQGRQFMAIAKVWRPRLAQAACRTLRDLRRTSRPAPTCAWWGRPTWWPANGFTWSASMTIRRPNCM